MLKLLLLINFILTKERERKKASCDLFRFEFFIMFTWFAVDISSVQALSKGRGEVTSSDLSDLINRERRLIFDESLLFNKTTTGWL